MKNDETADKTAKIAKTDPVKDIALNANELINGATETQNPTQTVNGTIEVVKWVNTVVDPEGGVTSHTNDDIVGLQLEINGKKFTRTLGVHKINTGLMNIGKFTGSIEIYPSDKLDKKGNPVMFGVARVIPDINKLSINQILLANSNAVKL